VCSSDLDRIEVIDTLIDALSEVLARENASLASGNSDFTDTTTREKLQLITRFNRVCLDDANLILPPELLFKVQDIVKLLSENEKSLKLRMEAIKEVTETITNAACLAESDGTYGADLKAGRYV